MKIAIAELPAGYSATVDDKRADVSFGDPQNPTIIRVATDGTDLILFPDRHYLQEELAKRLGLKS